MAREQRSDTKAGTNTGEHQPRKKMRHFFNEGANGIKQLSIVTEKTVG